MTSGRRATRTYLEMTSAADVRPAAAPPQPLVVAREHPCPAERYRALYLGVGAAYHWTDRAGWTDAEIHAHVTLPGVEVWTGHVEGALAGFFELRDWPDGSTEIAYFGLLPAFVGRGLGGALLTAALAQAWARTPTRVWLHTSSLDHPAALANYRARGFVVTGTEEYAVQGPGTGDQGTGTRSDPR
jgi:ribosomal protein S18 acetylase RimI-like enzyme